MAFKTLVFVPTYNECDNAPRMCEEIHKLGLDADVLFMDDNSPDGTGRLLEELKPRFPRLVVLHRSGKLGIGSAHFEAVQWAYDRGYRLMVTLDCDFTHSPADIPVFMKAAESCDVAVGSRWAREGSLPGWSVFRRCMTGVGHVLTRTVLDIPQDASGAFRAYRLDRLPRAVFHLVKSRGYPFFFESMFIFNRNGFSIREVPIVLPARTYCNSKMTISAAIRSAGYVFKLYLAHLRKPEQFRLERIPVESDATLGDVQRWDAYWELQSGKIATLYELTASIYRRMVIKRNHERTIRRVFRPGSALLHAGCGSGQVDVDLHGSLRITALDISRTALKLYAKNNPGAFQIKHGSILALPFPENAFDGIFNLGVVEHFTRDEISRIFSEFHRVLKPGGKVVVFWPHRRASSVLVLNAAHFVLNKVLRRKKELHPPEITLLRNRAEAEGLLSLAGFRLLEYRFGFRDFYVQAMVVAVKDAGGAPFVP
jgi:dolichol-phosphate mannosyltransferase